MQYYVKVFIKFKRKSSPPEICTTEPMSFEEAQLTLEQYTVAAEFVESPFFSMLIFPVAEGNQFCVYKISHDSKDQEAI